MIGTLLRVFLILLTSGILSAQTTVIEPQEIGVLLYRKGDNFYPLELQSSVKQERSPLFSAGVEQYLQVPGPKSSIRFRAGEPISLYLRTFLNESDPRAAFFPMRDPTKFVLINLTVRDKKERRMTMLKSGLTYTYRQAGRPLLIRLYGEQSFELTPSSTLEPGEYAIKYLGEQEDSSEDREQYDLFCFGVDP